MFAGLIWVVQVPNDLSVIDSVVIDVQLLLPQSSTGPGQPSLATYLPKFSQVLGDLDQVVVFNKLALEGPSSEVKVGVCGSVRMDLSQY